MKKTLAKIFTAVTFLAATTTFAHAASTTFPDVPENHTYYTAIEFLTANGIVKGYDNGTYGPAIILNRAEMLKIIAEASVKLTDQSSSIFDQYNTAKCFNDVKASQWYTKYICYAKANNWVVGYDNGKTFKPDQKVTFVEALKITYKGFGLQYEETPDIWYHDLVDQASAKNYIPFDVNGFNIGFRRDQMADLVTRILKANESLKTLTSYLGDREEIVVSYETLQQGLDLSKLKVETQKAGN